MSQKIEFQYNHMKEQKVKSDNQTEKNLNLVQRTKNNIGKIFQKIQILVLSTRKLKAYLDTKFKRQYSKYEKLLLWPGLDFFSDRPC